MAGLMLIFCPRFWTVSSLMKKNGNCLSFCIGISPTEVIHLWFIIEFRTEIESHKRLFFPPLNIYNYNHLN